MPDDYPCLVTPPPVHRSTGHNYYRLALGSRNLGCCVTLDSLSLPLQRGSMDHLPLWVPRLDRWVTDLLMQGHPLLTPAVSSCSRSSIPPTHSTSPHHRLSRDARATMLGPQSTGLCIGSCYAQHAPWTRRLQGLARTLRPPRGGRAESPSHSSLTDGLESRFSGYSPSGPGGRLETWEFNLNGESLRRRRGSRIHPRIIRSCTHRAACTHENRRKSRACPAGLRPGTMHSP